MMERKAKDGLGIGIATWSRLGGDKKKKHVTSRPKEPEGVRVKPPGEGRSQPPVRGGKKQRKGLERGKREKFLGGVGGKGGGRRKFRPFLEEWRVFEVIIR